MQLFKKLGVMLLMLVMVAQAQESVLELSQAASKGDPAAFAELVAHSDDADQSIRSDADQFGGKQRRAFSV